MNSNYRRNDGRMLMAVHWPVMNDDASGRGVNIRESIYTGVNQRPKVVGGGECGQW